MSGPAPGFSTRQTPRWGPAGARCGGSVSRLGASSLAGVSGSADASVCRRGAAFAGFFALRFGVAFFGAAAVVDASSVAMHQKRQPLQATPPMTALPAAEGLLNSRPSASR